MNRIVIIGSGRAGKSTLVRELGQRLGLPVIHLDRLYWRPGWEPTPRPEWVRTQQSLLEQPCWIMDGNFGATMDLRLEATDTILFLDVPRLICLWHVIKRQRLYRNKARPDMAAGCPERLTGEFLRFIWSYPDTRKPVILEKPNRYRDRKRVVVLKSRRDITAFLEGVYSSPS